MATLRAKRVGTIPAYPGYVVTEHGEVYSAHNNRWGIKRDKPMKLLSAKPGHGGYPVVNIRSADGECLPVMVHTLVLLAFVGPAPEGQLCRHLDGNPANNHLSNLKWGTPVENTADARAHGTMAMGAASVHAKFSEMQVLVIRELAISGIPQRAIAKSYEVADSCISKIVNRRTWAHI